MNDIIDFNTIGADISKIKRLIFDSEDVNLTDLNNRTILMYASECGHIELVRILLSIGADINAKTPDGITPLIIASKNGFSEVVDLLLKKGANINAKTKDGLTAKDVAIREKHEKVIEKIEEHVAALQEVEDSLVPHCCLCNEKKNIVTFYVPCVAETHLLIDPVQRYWKVFKDSIKIWQIALCDTCSLKNYETYQKERKKSSWDWLLIGLTFGIVGFILIQLGDAVHFFRDLYKINRDVATLCVCVTGLLSIIGNITWPIALFLYIFYSYRLQKFKKTGLESGKGENYFIFVAEKILNEMQSSKTTCICSKFQLPRFFELSELKKIYNDYHLDSLFKNRKEKRKILKIASPSFFGLKKKLKRAGWDKRFRDLFVSADQESSNNLDLF